MMLHSLAVSMALLCLVKPASAMMRGGFLGHANGRMIGRLKHTNATRNVLGQVEPLKSPQFNGSVEDWKEYLMKNKDGSRPHTVKSHHDGKISIYVYVPKLPEPLDVDLGKEDSGDVEWLVEWLQEKNLEKTHFKEHDNRIWKWDSRLQNVIVSFPRPEVVSGDKPTGMRPKLSLPSEEKADKKLLEILGTHDAARQRNGPVETPVEYTEAIARVRAAKQADENAKIHGDGGDSAKVTSTKRYPMNDPRVSRTSSVKRQSRSKGKHGLTSVKPNLYPAPSRRRRLMDRLHISEKNGRAC